MLNSTNVEVEEKSRDFFRQENNRDKNELNKKIPKWEAVIDFDSEIDGYYEDDDDGDADF